MKKHLCIILVLFSINSFAQFELSELGEITVDDLKVTHCRIDSLADAQILFEKGETRFLENLEGVNYQFTKTARIQILNKDGYEHGEIEILIYCKDAHSQENISEFKATSYSLENGKIVENTVKRSALITEKISDKYIVKKYAFPNIKPGTIIEYSYKITSPYLAILPQWYFQHKIPVLESLYKISLSPRVSYVLQKSGFLEFDFDTVYTLPYGLGPNGVPQLLKIYEWVLKDVPAFTDTKYVTTDEDYLMSVKFQLETYYPQNGGKRKFSSTWKQMSEELLVTQDNFGGYIKQNSGNIKEQVKLLNLSDKDDYEKIRIIIQYVKDNYHFNKEFGLLTDQTKKDFLVTKTGNAAEINLMLLSMLNAAEIEAYPLLLSTRSHGTVYYHYPMLTSFNYVAVIAKISDGSLILDATNPYLSYAYIPSYCVNGVGFEVKKMDKDEDAQFYPLNPAGSKIKMQQVISINPQTDSVNVVVATKMKGYNAAYLRELYSEKGKSAISDYLKEKVSGEITNFTIDNVDNVETDLVIKLNVEKKVESIGNKIIISPFTYNEYPEAIFTSETRDYPVDFGNTYNEKFVVTFQIPEGYEIDFVPENFSICDLDNSVVYKAVVIKNNNIIQILSDIDITKSKYEKKDYPILKYFFDKIVEFHNQKIILKKE